MHIKKRGISTILAYHAKCDIQGRLNEAQLDKTCVLKP